MILDCCKSSLVASGLIMMALFVTSLGKRISLDQDQQLVYECDFDSPNNCNISQSLKSTKVIKQVSKLILPDQQYTITDISSITLPASNNLTCQIPFSYSNKRYFHCTELNQCRTDQGMTSCFSSGSFLGGSSRANFEEIIEIDLGRVEFGWYELSYEYFLYCASNDTACGQKKDFIQVDLENSNQKVVKHYNQFYRQEQYKSKWRKSSKIFRLEGGLIKMNIVFHHENSGYESVFGFDHVKLEEFYPTKSDIEIYSCNYDSDFCGATVDSDTEDFEMQTVKTSTVVSSSGSYTITDVTSITKETKNLGKNCTIPFTISNVEYYHCTDSYKCQVDSVTEDTDECADGMFLNAKTLSPYQAQTATAEINSINIKEDGEYTIEYYTFVYCDDSTDAECNTRDEDFIQITVTNAGNEVLDTKYTEKLKKWTKIAHSLELKQGTLEIKIEFIRLNDFQDIVVQYGFDSLRLFKSESVSTSTSATTSETSDSTLTESPESTESTVSSSASVSPETDSSTVSSSASVSPETDSSTVSSSASISPETDSSSSTTTTTTTTTLNTPTIVLNTSQVQVSILSSDFKLVNDGNPPETECDDSDVNLNPQEKTYFWSTSSSEKPSATFDLTTSQKGSYILSFRVRFYNCDNKPSGLFTLGLDDGTTLSTIDAQSVSPSNWTEPRLVLIELANGKATGTISFDNPNKNTSLGIAFINIEPSPEKDSTVLIILLATLVPLAAFTILLSIAIYVKRNHLNKPELLEMANFASR